MEDQDQDKDENISHNNSLVHISSASSLFNLHTYLEDLDFVKIFEMIGCELYFAFCFLFMYFGYNHLHEYFMGVFFTTVYKVFTMSAVLIMSTIYLWRGDQILQGFINICLLCSDLEKNYYYFLRNAKLNIFFLYSFTIFMMLTQGYYICDQMTAATKKFVNSTLDDITLIDYAAEELTLFGGISITCGFTCSTMVVLTMALFCSQIYHLMCEILLHYKQTIICDIMEGDLTPERVQRYTNQLRFISMVFKEVDEALSEMVFILYGALLFIFKFAVERIPKSLDIEKFGYKDYFYLETVFITVLVFCILTLNGSEVRENWKSLQSLMFRRNTPRSLNPRNVLFWNMQKYSNAVTICGVFDIRKSIIPLCTIFCSIYYIYIVT